MDDVACNLSNLVEFIISCRSPVLTLFEQHPHLVQCSMYNPSDIDNIDYVMISSVSHSPSYCIDGRIKCDIYRKLAYIYYSTVIYVRSSVIAIRMMSIIVHLSSTLERLLVVVRTSIYNNTACILPVVLMVL